MRISAAVGFSVTAFLKSRLLSSRRRTTESRKTARSASASIVASLTSTWTHGRDAPCPMSRSSRQKAPS